MLWGIVMYSDSFESQKNWLSLFTFLPQVGYFNQYYWIGSELLMKSIKFFLKLGLLQDSHKHNFNLTISDTRIQHISTHWLLQKRIFELPCRWCWKAELWTHLVHRILNLVTEVLAFSRSASHFWGVVYIHLASRPIKMTWDQNNPKECVKKYFWLPFSGKSCREVQKWTIKTHQYLMWLFRVGLFSKSLNA